MGYIEPHLATSFAVCLFLVVLPRRESFAVLWCVLAGLALAVLRGPTEAIFAGRFDLWMLVPVATSAAALFVFLRHRGRPWKSLEASERK